MANNSPTNLAKGGEKEKAPKTIEELEAEKKVSEGEVKPLDAESTEPQQDAAAQPAADLALEQARGKVFGDITSSNGDSNTRGQHGRDGGVVPEGPSNPVPSDAAIAPEPAPSDDEITAASDPSSGNTKN